MQQLRGISKLSLVASGPGNLTQAMCISMEQYGNDLLQKSKLYIEPGIRIDPTAIEATKRIGISKATDKLWRFYIKKGVLL